MINSGLPTALVDLKSSVCTGSLENTLVKASRIERTAKQVVIECTYGDWACDTHQRFMYKCAKNGTWSEPYQCSRAGGCQPEGPTSAFPEGRMTCAGFPKYLYPYPDSRGSPDAETKEKYRKSMCADEACKDCDRCTYKLGYGEVVQPDLSTLLHGSPVPDNFDW
ncbi:hypothetical protein J4E91_010539 [Alternaria rosae]|nr:hypothetical protein J4E91_010539 [Alternaria rosae]